MTNDLPCLPYYTNDHFRDPRLARMTMEKQHRVVLYSSSLSMLGIEASLRECPALEVIRVDR